MNAKVDVCVCGVGVGVGTGLRELLPQPGNRRDTTMMMNMNENLFIVFCREAGLLSLQAMEGKIRADGAAFRRAILAQVGVCQ